MHPLIVSESDGFPLDHIGLGVPDFAASLDLFERRTGVRPLDLGAFGAQRRAVVRFSAGSFLEILGPDPDYSGALDPITAFAKKLEVPSFLFWYVAVSDFDAFATHASQAGHPLLGVQHIQREGYDYRIGGPDGISHVPVVPWIIQWKAKPDSAAAWPLAGKMVDFYVEHPEPPAIQAILNRLGIALPIQAGDSARIALKISTPKGVIEF